MATVSTVDLIAKFQYALDNNWGYIINKWHTMWTESLQEGVVRDMKNKYGTNWRDNANAKKDTYYQAAYYGAKWIGHWVTDCSGLFYWAFKELGGYMYHGSNTMWNKYCASQGKLSKGKRTDGRELKPGTAVFVLKNGSDRSHVGLYVGNDNVIEASGTQSGVIITKITNSKWCEWGELKGVDYGANPETPVPAPEPVVDANTAIVNDTRVALRAGPSTSSTVLLRIDKGEQVQLLDDPDWTPVKYKGKTGYMMTKYLTTNNKL